MEVSIITFTLAGISTEHYRDVCAELAPAFAEIPGLLAKVWLADPRTNTYGGVYLFDDAAAADGFKGSALFRAVSSYPHFCDVDVRCFAVDEETTKRTQPGLCIVSDALTAR